MGVIYALSDRPAGDLHQAVITVSYLPFASTVIHITLYLILSIFVLRTLVVANCLPTGLKIYLTLFVALVYGILDEFHQSNVKGRSSEVNDVVADVFGAVLVVLFWYVYKIKRKTGAVHTNDRRQDEG
jgi:VanZ family protein